MQDDFRLRGQHRPLPKALQRTKRLLKIVLGFTLVVIGAAMLVLPGAGWPTIGLGLVILAAELGTAPAEPARKQAMELGRSVSGGTGPNESSGSC